MFVPPRLVFGEGIYSAFAQVIFYTNKSEKKRGCSFLHLFFPNITHDDRFKLHQKEKKRFKIEKFLYEKSWC